MIEIKANPEDHTVTLRIGKDTDRGWQCVEERLSLDTAEHTQAVLFMAIVAAKGDADAG